MTYCEVLFYFYFLLTSFWSFSRGILFCTPLSPYLETVEIGFLKSKGKSIQ